MKIIDFLKVGNVFRLYLGKDDLKEYYGDDWNDHPYHLNAGEVYDEFVSGYVEYALGLDWVINEPCDRMNCFYSKDELVAGNAPALTFIKLKEGEYRWEHEGDMDNKDAIRVFLDQKYNPEDFKFATLLRKVDLDNRD